MNKDLEFNGFSFIRFIFFFGDVFQCSLQSLYSTSVAICCAVARTLPISTKPGGEARVLTIVLCRQHVQLLK